MGLQGGNLVAEFMGQQPIITIEILDVGAPGLEPAPFPRRARAGIGLMDHQDPPRILTAQRLEHRGGAVGGPIIHQQHFQVAMALVEHTLHRRRHELRTVVDRNNGANQGGRS